MTEIDALKHELEQQEKSFNKLHKMYVSLLKQQGELEKENEQLKKEIGNLRDFRGFITEKNVFNEKERKELQLQLLRLYNYFENYFEDEMSSNAFSEMWDNIKEDEKWEKGDA